MTLWGWVLQVFVREGYMVEHRCDWLGHHSYRCGKCRKGYFRVRAIDDHDEECPHCKARVIVLRSSE